MNRTITVIAADVNGYPTGWSYVVKVVAPPENGLATSITQSDKLAASVIAEGHPFTTELWAFKDTGDPAAPASSYAATVDWGDGVLKAATIIKGEDGILRISAAGYYRRGGTYSPALTIMKVGFAPISCSATVKVVGPALSVSGEPVTMKVDSDAQVVVATFQSSNPESYFVDFKAKVEWVKLPDSDNFVPATVAWNPVSQLFEVRGSHNYVEMGMYDLRVMVISDGGPADSAVVVDTLVVVTPPVFVFTDGNPTAVAGSEVTGELAQFTGVNSQVNRSEYTTTISWGDGSQNSVRGSGDGLATISGGFKISLPSESHIYRQPGVYEVVVTVEDGHGGFGVYSRQLSVTNYTLTFGGLTEPERKQKVRLSPEQLLGTISGFPSASFRDEVTVRAYWGDGTNSVVELRPTSGTEGKIYGSHAYQTVDNYSVVLEIMFPDGTTVSATRQLKVDAPALTFARQESTAVQGQRYTVDLGTITDEDTSLSPSAYSATISWDNGTTQVPGVIAVGPDGKLHLYVTTTFNSVQDFWAVITISNPHGELSVPGTNPFPENVKPKVTVTGATRSVEPLSIVAQAGIGFKGPVAIFHPGIGGTVAGDYTASINLGGSTIAAVVVAQEDGTFLVRLETEYTFPIYQSGLMSYTVTVTHTGTNVSTEGTGIGEVLPVRAAAQGRAVTAAVGAAFNDVIATFHSSVESVTASDFQATIWWNDNESQGGSITLAGGVFEVRPTEGRSFDNDAVYAVRVEIIFYGRVVATASSSMVVGTGGIASMPDTYYVRAGRTLTIGSGDAATLGVLKNDVYTGGALSVQWGTITGMSNLGTDGSFKFSPPPGNLLPYPYTIENTYTPKYGTLMGVTTRVNFVITNAAPTVSSEEWTFTHPGENQAITVSAGQGLLINDYDEDGHTLNVVAGEIYIQGGTVTLASNGSFQFKPASTALGKYSFNYTVTDGFETRAATAVINLTDDVAAATAKTFRTKHGTVISGNFLTGVVDPNLQALSVTSMTGPSNFQAFSHQANGDFSFTPVAGFVGVTSFTATLSDGIRSVPMTVYIDVWDNAPTIGGKTIAAARSDLGAQTQLMGTLSLSDWDNDSLSVGVLNELGNAATFENGTLTLSIVNNVLNYTYKPNMTFQGTQRFLLEASDGALKSERAVFEVDMKNFAPRVVEASFTGKHGVPLTFDLRPFAWDAEGSPLTFELSQGSHYLYAPPNSVTPACGNGVFTFAIPSWMAAKTGEFSFMVDVRDGLAATPMRVNVNITNSPPSVTNDQVIIDLGDTAIFSSSLIPQEGIFTPLANDFDMDDGPSLRMLLPGVVNGSPISSVYGGSLTNITFDGATNYVTGFKFEPNATFIGVTEIPYEVNDGAAERKGSIQIIVNAGSIYAKGDSLNGTVMQPIVDYSLIENDSDQAKELNEDGRLVYWVRLNDKDTSWSQTNPESGQAATEDLYSSSGDFGGTMSVDRWGKLNFTPLKPGIYSFQYKVSIVGGAVPEGAPVNVTINVARPTLQAVPLTLEHPYTKTVASILTSCGAAANYTVVLTGKVTDAKVWTTGGSVPTSAGGTVELNQTENGLEVKYTPPGNYVGNDYFTYRLEGPAGVLSNEATVTVTIEGGAPMLAMGAAAPDFSVDQGSFLSVNVITDGEDSLITYGGNPAIGFTPYRLVLESTPTNGTAYFEGNVLRYEPRAEFYGTDQLSYRVYDAQFNSAFVSVNIPVTRTRMPLAYDVAYAASTSDLFSIDLTEYIRAVDSGATLSVNLANTSGLSATVSGKVVSVDFANDPDANGYYSGSFDYTVTETSGGVAYTSEAHRVTFKAFERWAAVRYPTSGYEGGVLKQGYGALPASHYSVVKTGDVITVTLSVATSDYGHAFEVFYTGAEPGLTMNVNWSTTWADASLTVTGAQIFVNLLEVATVPIAIGEVSLSSGTLGISQSKNDWAEYDSVISGAIGAPVIGTIFGNVTGTVTTNSLSGIEGDYFSGQLTVNGNAGTFNLKSNLTGSISVTGNVATIDAGRIDASITIGGSISRLTVKGSLAGTLSVGGNITQLDADASSTAVITASSIGTIHTKGDLAGSVTGVLGGNSLIEADRSITAPLSLSGGRFDEKAARADIEGLARMSAQLAKTPPPVNVTGWYYPVEIDPTWMEAALLKPLLADLPTPLWISVYDSANVGPEELAQSLVEWLPPHVGVFFQDGVGVHARDAFVARHYANVLVRRLGRDRVRVIAEAFRPKEGGGFRTATLAELQPQLAAYAGLPIYLFEGPRYVPSQLVHELAAAQKARQ